MTAEEAMRLREGQPVQARYSDGWKAAVVVGEPWGIFSPHGKIVRCRVRREGTTVNGQRLPARARPQEHIRLVPPPPAPANIYADWLEDHGHPAAAQALREAFPLGDRAP